MPSDISRRTFAGLAIAACTTALTFQARAAEASVGERVRKVIADDLMLDINKVTPDARIDEDLGADSLDGVELVMAVEEEFHIEIPDDDAEKIVTVGDAIAYVEAHVKK